MASRRAKETHADAERSFEQLYRGHRVDVYRAALRELGNVHDAEDVTQAAFVDAYRAVMRGTQPQAPRAWLLAIAENVRRRRFRTSLRRPLEEPLDADAGLAAEESHEQAGALLEALASLTTEQREAFLLREISGLSYDEIADRTGSTVGSVQMLLFRARKSLRDELEPPHVHGALLPLVTLLSRFEPLGLTPRAAGVIGAAALAVGVSASVPGKADHPPPARPAAPALVAVAPQPVLVTAAPIKRAATPKPVRAKRRAPTTTPALVLAGQPVNDPPQAAPPPARPTPSPRWESQPVTPALLAAPVVPTPSIPLPPSLSPLVETVVQPVLEIAGAAGAAGASAPPLPVLPLDSLPPVLP